MAELSNGLIACSIFCGPGGWQFESRQGKVRLKNQHFSFCWDHFDMGRIRNTRDASFCTKLCNQLLIWASGADFSIQTAIPSQMVGLSSSDRRDEGGLNANGNHPPLPSILFHTLSLKGVGDQLAWAILK